MPGEDDELTARARARLGTTLKGKYRLDRVLGIGGMATVYAATHTRNGDRVAVKVLHPEISVDKTLRERFLREGYAANSVGHAGTVRVIDDDVEKDGAVFLVMDLLQGETLEARRERVRRLPIAEVVPLLVDLLVVLEAAHAKGITHRDLKPENLFVTNDGTLKILDFGVARLHEASPTRTKSGSVFGTPAYMPPEQALGRVRDVDALSDVWAVGATAFTLLCGRYVHDAETAEQMLISAAIKPAPSIFSVAPHVPTDIGAVIDRALAYEKKDRWQSAREMREALQRASASTHPNEVADDWSDENEKTYLAPVPQMTAPLVSAGAPTVDMDTIVKASTIGGVATTGKQAARKLSRTLIAGTAGGGLFFVLAVLLVALVVMRIRETEPMTAESSTSESVVAGASAVSTNVTNSSSPVASAAPSSISVDALPRAAASSSGTAPTTPRPSPLPSVTARPSAVPAPPNPYCSPPYEEVNGVRRWKRGCL